MNNFLTQEYLFMIGPTAVLSLALAAVAVSYVFLLIKLGKSEKDKVFLQSKIRDQTSEILNDAHEKRLKIIQEAMEKGHSILKDTQAFSIEIKGQFASDLQALRKRQEELVIIRSEEISKLYEQFAINLRQGTEDQFKEMSKNMQDKALLEIEEFRKEIENERIFMQKQLSGKLEVEYKKAQKDIEDYKLDQIKKLDKQVFDIVHTLTREVLGRSLSLQDHADLVQKALIKMKLELGSDMS